VVLKFNARLVKCQLNYFSMVGATRP